ncbi:MAG: glycine/betaine ABC transporter substrate-binding protein, partial [Candidatus Nanopelagicales bacterium]
MRVSTRRGLAIAAASIIALGGASVLTACGGSSEPAASSSAAESTGGEAGMIGPVIVEPGQTTAEVQVGRMVTF